MNNGDEFPELRDHLRRRADAVRPTNDLVGGSLARARRIRLRRTVAAATAAVLLAAGGIAGAGVVRAQWSDGGRLPVAAGTASPSRAPVSPTPEPSTDVTAAPTAPGVPPSSVEPTVPSGTATAVPPPASSPNATSGRSTPSQASTRCTAAATTISVRAGQGAAGHVEYVLTLTNTGDQPCTVYGYPGVSVVAGDDGTQVGAPADRDRDHGAPGVVTVDPGGTATASLWMARADNYGADCRMVEARGFRIYLPEERAAQFAPIPVRGCASPAIHLMQVRPFVPG